MKNRMIARFGKIALCMAVFAVWVASSAQGQAVSAGSVPANTVKAFQAASGGATATWMAGPNNSYEATFVKEGQSMVYVYDQQGVLQLKKIVSTIATFPASVNSAITAAYPSGKVEYAYKVVNRSNQKCYEVQVANPSGVERMRFDLTGKPIGKTSLAASQPAGSQPIAAATSKPQPTVTSPTASTQPAPAKTSPPVAMRGESATTTKAAPTAQDDLLDDDMGDLLEDVGDMDDLFKEEENWEDIDLGDDLEDDSDLLDATDDLDDGFDLDLGDDEDDL